MKTLVLSLAALLIASPALAGQAVSLRSDTTDADGRVTLGELFDGAGAASDMVIATRAGPTVVLDAAQVQITARRAGLDWSNPNGVRRIIVRAGSGSGGDGALAGASRGNVEVLAYARSMATGDIVQPEDLIWVKAAASPSDAPRDADALIGMTAKRALRQGSAASLRDVSTPLVIKAGDIVAVTYEDAGVALTLQGKAMAAGAVGDSLMVQNTASKKIIETVVTGPGSTAVGPQAMRLKASRNSLRYAAR
ncbi:flagellar basal body ring protein [Caulobacter sp. Root655]|uniref:flagellar basal body P-ring formation chaperone FlgA n=1 Tax=Caulobacter sp. Root655 TaxID=1736578 RepID=UPI0006FE866E|nr:flagellar basal body P-ring formation chaperone FlgA [Caulobacter sp. Root655]KRA59545.1 flagellar basal body ring protein [Caulobacter sp. Root655]